MPFKWCLKAYKIAEAGIVLVSASVCMCAEFLRRLVLQNGDIWFWRLYITHQKFRKGTKNISYMQARAHFF